MINRRNLRSALCYASSSLIGHLPHTFQIQFAGGTLPSLSQRNLRREHLIEFVGRFSKIESRQRFCNRHHVSRRPAHNVKTGAWLIITELRFSVFSTIDLLMTVQFGSCERALNLQGFGGGRIRYFALIQHLQ